MALKHKQLDVSIKPIKFCEQEKIAFSSQTLVPVITDNDTIVSDSWKIACYLEDNYSEKPKLFGNMISRNLTKTFNDWVDLAIHPALIKIILLDIYNHAVDLDDRDYFRESREKRFKMPLEKFCTQSEADINNLHSLLMPINKTLKNQAYICGEQPAYADYILFGSAKFAALTSPLPAFPDNGPIDHWMQRMMQFE
tara:strand:- start:389 stop:976 length:588 start_codon:yes stop_codon:yes gene_type:complete